jgi:hypothetical protein
VLVSVAIWLIGTWSRLRHVKGPFSTGFSDLWLL